MNAFSLSLTALTALLLKMSLQASLVIALVLLVQWVWRRTLSPRVRYALWFLVVLRLVLPTSLESSLSVFQQARTATAAIARAANSGSVTPVAPSSAPAARSAEPARKENRAAPAPKLESPATPASVANVGSNAGHPASAPAIPARGRELLKTFPWAVALSVVWLAGVVWLLARIITIPLRLNARLARHETAPPPAVFEILEQAKRSIGVNQVLPIVQSRAVQSPALLGFIRPWLLLPHGLVEKFTSDELRLVFLHELAHLKRRDIAVNWLTTLLQILHWFNPLVWIAFARMRADREEACDELALAHARAEENRAYGHAIIKLLEGFSRPPALPGLVGILEDKQHMQRRITMIAQFKRMIPWSAPAAGLFLVLGIFTLTDAQTEKTDSQPVTPLASATIKTLVSGPDAAAMAILAPDETAFIYIDPDTRGIVLCDIATGTKKTLTGSESPDDNFPAAAWSPDSKTIVYTWELHNAEHNGPHLRMVSREGGAPKILREVGADFFFPSAWSLDGKFLVGERFKGGYAGLAIEVVATGELRPLGLAGHQSRHPRFSPDGKFIVYARVAEGNTDIFITSVDGKKTTRVTDSPAEDRAPVFSPDGRMVLFSSDRRGAWDLWGVPVENGVPVGAPVPLKYDFGDNPKWITSQGRLAFRLERSGSDVFEISATNPDTRPRPLTKSFFGRNGGAVAWSPDGKRIAYERDNGRRSFCVQSLVDGAEETFDPDVSFIQGLFWAPDGQTIALLCAPKGKDDGSRGRRGVYLFSLKTRTLAPEPIGRNETGLAFPIGFSADGKEFLYHDQRRGRIAIDLVSGARRDVPTTIAGHPAWRAARIRDAIDYSDDGNRVVFASEDERESRLFVADVSAPEPNRIIARHAKPARIERVRSSPDGTKVAYLLTSANSKTGRGRVHVAAADGSWDREIGVGEKFVSDWPRNVSWSSDSSKFAITLSEPSIGQLAVLENFLPSEKPVSKRLSTD